MYAQVHILGYAAKDPETVAAGASNVTRLSLGVTQRYNSKSGTPVEKQHWHDIEVWNKYGEAMAKHVRKGDQILVQGELLTDTWEDKTTGQKRKKNFIRATFWTITNRKADRMKSGSGEATSSQTAAPAGPAAPSSAVPKPAFNTPSAPGPSPVAAGMPAGMDNYMEQDDDLPF